MNLIEMIKHDEGKRLALYKDTVGLYTIGVGHCLQTTNKVEAIKKLDKKFERSTGGLISEKEVEDLLLEDIQKTIHSIQNNSALSPLYNSLDSNRKFALINMCFQLGVAGVAGFKKSVSLLLASKWAEAEVELKKSLWYRQTTNRALRVISVFRTGTLDAY